MYFFLFLPLSTTKIHEHYTGRLGKMRAEGLGTSGTKEQHGGEFPEFSFCLRDPRLDAGEARNPDTPTGAKKEKLQQKPPLSSRRIRKGTA